MSKWGNPVYTGASKPRHYTVRWDQQNAQMVRLNDAAHITTTTTNFKYSGSVNPAYNNPFDRIYPWSGRKLCNISLADYMALQSGDNIKDCVTHWEGEQGFSYSDPDGVWVYTPDFYGKSWWHGGYRYYDVTDGPFEGYIHYPEQISARWRGTAETRTIGGAEKQIILSKPGMPIKNTALSTIHTYANNAGLTLDNVFSLDASLLLYLVEYANYNAQGAIGSGVSGLYRQSSDLIKAAATDSTVVQVEYSSAIVGVCIPGAIFDIGTSNGGAQVGSFIIQSAERDSQDSTILNVTLDRATTVTSSHYWSIHGLVNLANGEIGSKSGYIGSNGKADAYYRGEALWGDMFYYVLGAYKSSSEHVWLTKSAAEADNYDALNTENHLDTGIVLASSSDYIKTLDFPDSLDVLSAPSLCTAIGGSSSNPVGDYFYTTTGNNRILLVGGGAGGGASDGPFYWYWYSSAGASNWYISGRPLLKSP